MARHPLDGQSPQPRPRLEPSASLCAYLESRSDEAFSDAYTACRPYLIQVFRRFRLRTHELDDAIHDTWLQLILYRGPHRPEECLSLLARIGVNTLIDNFRSSSARHAREAIRREDRAPLAVGHHLLISDEVRHTIGCMTPAQREAWNMWGRAQTLSGHPTPLRHTHARDICAAALGISSNAFACRLKGGLEHLASRKLRVPVGTT